MATGAVLEATQGQAHYLAAVMRRAIGETVRLFNGADGEWEARILALRRDRARLSVERRLRPQAPEPDLWLAFAVLKRDATDLLVQKATELGASVLLPVLSARCNAARINPDRLAAIATEAAEQCERLTVPRLAPPQRLPDLLAGWPAARPLFAALERAAVPPLRPQIGPAGLLIGPEGGFAPGELDELVRHTFVKPVSLGPRILRAETAAIVGLALLQAPGGG
ncbi:MAG: 16S rRNA (uracil(1498)-N(3))-methyltransferase [Rhodospirillales bacterium]|nr:16S rRNA (uracil(1498)-N(3))-methyltransferase [Rhodospirillales bacterium]